MAIPPKSDSHYMSQRDRSQQEIIVILEPHVEVLRIYSSRRHQVYFIQFSLFPMSHLVVVYQVHTDLLVKSWGDAILASCVVIIGHVRPALISVIFVMLCDDGL
jgi:hypothetical protein